MLIKTIFLFLAAMALVGMIGKVLFPGAIRRAVGRNIPRASGCPRCGRYVIGRAGCDCKTKG